MAVSDWLVRLKKSQFRCDKVIFRCCWMLLDDEHVHHKTAGIIKLRNLFRQLIKRFDLRSDWLATSRADSFPFDLIQLCSS